MPKINVHNIHEIDILDPIYTNNQNIMHTYQPYLIQGTITKIETFRAAVSELFASSESVGGPLV